MPAPEIIRSVLGLTPKGKFSLNSDAPELSKQRREIFDDALVRRAVRGDQAVTILNLGAIVHIRLPEEVRESPARLGQDGFRRARVPLFSARAQVNIQVALLFDNQPDLDADRASLHLFFD